MNKHLTYEERIKIETLLEQKIKPYKIARILNRSIQTIYNEIKRGSVTQIDTHLRSYNVYKSDYAQNIHDINMSHCGVDLKVGSDFSFLDLVQKIIKEKCFRGAKVSSGNNLFLKERLKNKNRMAEMKAPMLK